VVTDQSGMDPLDLEGYLAAGGFAAYQKCVSEMQPLEVVELIEASGLRGRGGAGYPTGTKWREVAAESGAERFVICNGDEGDPGAFMDRLTLESFPFRVLEGMAIAAYAVGARSGFLFIRTEYPLAIRRVAAALEACRERGIFGERFSLEISESAGAFVCGEETALIAAMEGRRANPRLRPPYPAEQGLRGMPTLVNNVETLATVPWIVRNGPSAFRSMGTQGSPGTKTFALAGKILRGGLIEVPMGMSIRRIVEEIGGGIQGEKKLKAVQIGGPSGGCIPESLADLPVDFESLTEAGAMMGSGGMVVLDETDCMVDVARYFMSFTQRESCGKCAPCRVGTRRMLDVLERLCAGTGRPGDVGLLEELAGAVREGSLCGLGRTAPNPVLTTLRYFRAEYEAHAAGACPAGRCKALISYAIGDECIGCTRCAQRCPAHAIEARPYEKHSIDESLCIRCGTCRQSCPSDAVQVVPRSRDA
jgi:NADH:ubiquinone oxidoreductase subunit F (NADH-binding)/NAD-dependent dihydropyrimidine dehydrogenase PreA subunit